MLEVIPNLVGDLMNLLLGLLEGSLGLGRPLSRAAFPPGRLVVNRRGRRSLEQAHDPPLLPHRGAVASNGYPPKTALITQVRNAPINTLMCGLINHTRAN